MADMPAGPPPSRSAARAAMGRSAPPYAPPVGVAADQPLTDVELGRRAQLLATEHWGLLAARSTAQSEVLTRITIFLTLVSAGLVTIGLLGQVTRFSDWFSGAALAILGFLALIGLITHVRVLNASEEDMMYVVAMNRIRAAYVDLDPGVARYFLSAVNDDRAGMERTYSFLRRRSISHLLGSSMSLVAVVVGCVFGLLVGAVLTVVGASTVWAVTGGIISGVAYAAAMSVYSGSTFTGTWRSYRPLRPTRPDAPTRQRDTPGIENSEIAPDQRNSGLSPI